MSTNARPDLFDTAEAAAYIRASKSWLDKARTAGQGPAFVRRGARVYYLRQDLDQFIDQSREVPCPSTSTPEAPTAGAASTSPAASTAGLRARQIAAQLLRSSGSSAASSRLTPKPKLLRP